MAVQSLDAKKLEELRQLVDDMSNQAVLLNSIRERAVAVGMPRPLLVRVVSQLANDEGAKVDGMMDEIKVSSEKQVGVGSFDLLQARKMIDEMVQHELDLRHFRKISSSYGVDIFVINKLVELRQKCPLDKGEGLLREMASLAGIGLSSQSEVTQDQSDSIPSDQSHDTRRSNQAKPDRGLKQLFVDILLGLGLGVGAILLLS